MAADQRSGLDWRDGVIPVSTRFNDPYFSVENELEETRHVFLAGNSLPARFRDGFHIAELGFGTGLNMLTALAAWRAAAIPGHLHFTSFEAFPLTATDITRALAAFPQTLDMARPFLEQWAAGARTIRLPDLTATIIPGDARQTLPQWHGQADAWFLDGFAPARNPEMWDDELMVQVARRTAPQGSFATYTAAGHVRRALASAGFEVRRQPGYGRKRHMTTGQLKAAP